VALGKAEVGNSSPVVGDLDGDGLPEVVVLEASSRAVEAYVGDVHVFTARGQRLSAFCRRLRIGRGAVPAIADIDRDGRNELIVTSQLAWGSVGYVDSVWVYDFGGPTPHGPVQWGQFMAGPRHQGAFRPTGRFALRPPIPPTRSSWHDFFAVDPLETPMVGDFNGDGRTDIITFTRQNPRAVGDVYVALSDGTRFVDRNGRPNSADKWHDWFAVSADETVVIGDYDGDGRDDIATWLRTSTRQVYVALSTGLGMRRETVWKSSIGFDPSDVLLSGDVDGDGRDDLLLFARKQGKVYSAMSSGSGFLQLWEVHGFFAVSTRERPRVADVNGDSRADILTFATDSPTAFGDVYVALSNGGYFVDLEGRRNASSKWHDWFAISPAEEIRFGDLDADGKSDIFTFLPPPWGQCYTVLSRGKSMAENVLWPETVTHAATDRPFTGDVNGDGRADVIVFAQGEGKVYVSLAP
jgi:hypothetical protein